MRISRFRLAGVVLCGSDDPRGRFLPGETIRKMIPRTVLLSCLSGLGLLLLAMNPMLQAFEAPTVSFIVLLLIFINWFGKSRFSPVSRQACCC